MKNAVFTSPAGIKEVLDGVVVLLHRALSAHSARAHLRPVDEQVRLRAVTLDGLRRQVRAVWEHEAFFLR